MPSPSRTLWLAFFLSLASGPLLSGCGKDAQGGNAVAMKDLEVTDGTATDAMTDLDGVRGQSAAASPIDAPADAPNAAAPQAAGNAGAAVSNDSNAATDR